VKLKIEKKMVKLDKKYWEKRYETGDTSWDVGEISRPIREFVDKLPKKDIRILIPGAGNSYEAEYLHKNGFTNVFVLDIAEAPLKNFLERCPTFPVENIIQKDFFKYKCRKKYDLIIEQTFFCAIDPSLREEYMKKVHYLLKDNAKFMGLFFEKEFEEEGPPFGWGWNEYAALFSLWFDFISVGPCKNSIEPRAGTELFFLIRKRRLSIF
jgi:thiopurine S-methyltransferase